MCSPNTGKHPVEPKKIHPAADVQIQVGDFYFDSSLSSLLHLIDETGSVCSASLHMGVPCAEAWRALEMADSAFGKPLIQQSQTNSLDFTLSDHGRRLLYAYDQYAEAIGQQASELYQRIFQDTLA